MPRSTIARNVRFKWLAAVVLFFAATGLAAKTASMRLPPELAAAALRHQATGFGGANRGRYTLAGHRGEFVRIESRLAVFDPLFARSSGRSSFTLEGEAPVAAACEFRANAVTVGVVTFDPKKLVYACTVTGALEGTVTLGEPRPSGAKAKLLARSVRRGVAEVGGTSIEIDSVHHYDGSRLSSQTPVGYVLRHDGIAVAALELTDVEPTLIASDMSEDLRAAVVVTAMSLAVLRDPANSMLGD